MPLDVVLQCVTWAGLSKAATEILSLVSGVGDMKAERLDQEACVGWMAVLASFFNRTWKKRGKKKNKASKTYK